MKAYEKNLAALRKGKNMNEENDSFGYKTNILKEPERSKYKYYTREEIESFERYEESKKISSASTSLELKLDQEIILDGNDFIFPNLYVDEERYETVKLFGSHLENGAKKKFMKWWLVPPSQRNGPLVPNTIILYQMFHRAYANRNNAALQVTIEKFKSLIWNMYLIYDSYTGTYISYSGNSGMDATVRHVNVDGRVSNKKITVPEFEKSGADWTYLTLADFQPIKKLGTVLEIPQDAVPLLEALFGKNYADAGAVFQYAVQSNLDLPRAILWVPTKKARTDSAIWFKVKNYFDFQINTAIDRNTELPAFGIMKL